MLRAVRSPHPNPSPSGRGEPEVFDRLVYRAMLEAPLESQHTASTEARHTYYTTGDAGGFRAALRRLLSVESDVRALAWDGVYASDVAASLNLIAAD